VVFQNGVGRGCFQRSIGMGGLPYAAESTMKRGGLPPHSRMVPC
jgi:hypothetical protein